jgi:hypothetical protein
MQTREGLTTRRRIDGPYGLHPELKRWPAETVFLLSPGPFYGGNGLFAASSALFPVGKGNCGGTPRRSGDPFGGRGSWHVTRDSVRRGRVGA